MDLKVDDLKSVKHALQKLLEDKTPPKPSLESLPKVLNQILKKHPSISADVCEVIAKLAREAEFRSLAATEGSLVPSLVPLLESKNVGVLLQALRAIGNLCHEEDPCRQQFLDSGGCPLLCSVIKRCSDFSVSPKFVKLKTVACGCLLNICCENEALCKAMVSLDILRPLCEGILAKKEEEGVIQMGLQALLVIVESDSCTCSVVPSSSVLMALTSVLKSCIVNEIDTDLALTVLEILEPLCTKEDDEADKWKVSVANSHCFHLLLDLPAKFTHKVFDIVIHLVSSDQALDLLFTDDKLWSFVSFHMKEPSVKIPLKASAILVAANMARSDENCRSLIKRGVLDTLMKEIIHQLIHKEEQSSKLLFAIMSLLRNLSLSDRNKLVLLQNGVVQNVALVLEQTKDVNVSMKALGCLRMMTTENEVCQYISRSQVVERTSNICENAPFDHVKIEGSRFFVALTKNSKNVDPKRKVIKGGGMKWLLYLLTNDHLVMKNEGLVSLAILASSKLDAFYYWLKDTSFTIADSVHEVIKDCSTPEVLENCLTLLITLASYDDFWTTECIESLKEILEGLKDHKEEAIRKKALKILGQCK